MCGILAGIAKDRKLFNEQQVQAAVDSLHHRGPDDSGIFIEDDVMLAHTRLKIIDLSNAAGQPMSFAGQRLRITFNGEIYNYLELRHDLKARGHVFRTDGDTEVILASYLEWGQKCVNRFNGMWSFAIYDKQEQILFCSRDCFGIKPFYYVNDLNHFLLASEIRALTKFNIDVSPSCNHVASFILTGFMDCDDKTFYDGVKKLPPGTNLIYSISSGRVELSKYYSLDRIVQQDRNVDIAERLKNSLTLRLRSDVPVGCLLSGGVDSSYLAAATSILSKKGCDVTAITIASTEPEKDESKFAEDVVNQHNLKWKCFKPSYADFLTAVDEVTIAQEEPYGGPSLIMQHFAMKVAKDNGLKVVLSGQGADEVFLGYERYIFTYLLELCRKNPLSVIGECRSIFDNNHNCNSLSLFKNFVSYCIPNVRYKNYLHRQSFVRPDYIHGVRDLLFNYSKSLSSCINMQKYELTTSNLPMLLRYEDKSSMYHSIESRLPYLDKNLVSAVLPLPFNKKIVSGWTKYQLRTVLSQMISKNIAWRRDKIGFAAPERSWVSRYKGDMLEAIGDSAVLRKVLTKDFYNDYDNLSYREQWRLFSVAKWEHSFL